VTTTSLTRQAPSSHSGPSVSSPPALPLLALEPMRAALEFFASHVFGAPARVGDGHPVIVYPGLAANSWSTLRLRNALDAAGFRSHDWRQGFNRGPRGQVEPWLDQLEDLVHELHAEHGMRVSLVGWSLGGICARELAKRVPHVVRQVVTLGTPFAAPPKTTHADRVFRLFNGKSGPSQTMQRRLRQCPPVPTTSIYSRTDGVVPWQGCIQSVGAQAENIAVNSASHLGMGTHPTVLRILVDRLAQPEGQWKPYGS